MAPPGIPRVNVERSQVKRAGYRDHYLFPGGGLPLNKLIFALEPEWFGERITGDGVKNDGP